MYLLLLVFVDCQEEILKEVQDLEGTLGQGREQT